MKLAFLLMFFVIAISISSSFAQQAPKELIYSIPPNLPKMPPPGQPLGNFLKPEQGKAVLDLVIAQSPTLDAWKARTEFNRKHMLAGLGLDPLPKRNPLNAIVHDKRTHDGYTVENVAIESFPGFYSTGNLYRPLNATGPCPVVLSTHGHGPINQPDQHPRFTESMQQRCATLARMGAIVFAIDMFAYGDTGQQVPPAAHQTLLAAPVQIWGGMRALDFLLSLPNADPSRVAVTGESGGGTQAFTLTALDSRITVSVPVVMISSYMFGGCPCESGRPMHHSDEHFVTNAEIAAMCAPRPMLDISDGADWTQHTPDIEFPFLQKIYGLYGAEKNVQNVHLKDEKHDYGPSKRLAMDRFLAEQFKLNLSAAQDATGKLDESKVTIEQPKAMRVWNDANPLPTNALKGVDAIEAALKKQQEG